MTSTDDDAIAGPDGFDQYQESQPGFISEAQDWLSGFFPELFPSLPVPEERCVNITIPNPFIEDSVARYSCENRVTFTMPEDGAVNGYIKFRLRMTDSSDESHKPKHSTFGQSSMAVHHRNMPERDIPGNNVPYLPPDFGRESKLDGTDIKLLKFCQFL